MKNRLLMLTKNLRMTTIFCCFAALAFGQPTGGWEKTYNLTPNLYRVIQTQEGGYCALGPWDFDTSHVFLEKTDADGVTQWETADFLGDTLKGQTILQTPDGGYVIGRSTQDWLYVPKNDFSIVKYDAFGQRQWAKRHNLSPWLLNIYGMTRLPNGNLLSCGEISATPHWKGLLVLTDSDGNFLDSTLVTAPNGSFKILETHVLPNGEILAAGIGPFPPDVNESYYWLRFDADLNLLEMKNLNVPGYTAAANFDSNGDLFFNGSPAANILDIRRLDATGNQMWDKIFVTTQWGSIYPYYQSVAATGDGGCFFSSGEGEFVIGRLGPTGDLQWLKNFASNSLERRAFADVTATADGGVIAAGFYQNDFSQGQAYLIKLDSAGHLFKNLITGRYVFDQSTDCTADPTDPGGRNRIIEADPGSGPFKYYGTTDSTGRYEIEVPDGNYTVYAYSPVQSALCFDNQPASFPTPGNVAVVDFVDTLPLCPLLHVSFGTSLIRVCRPGAYYGVLTNYGTGTAEDAYVEVTLDNYLTFNTSTPPASSVNGQTIRLDLGDLPSGTSIAFRVHFDVDCSAPLGYEHCSEAHAYPDSSCLEPDSSWNRASLVVEGACVGDSVRFLVRNRGAGAMTEKADFIVIEDDMIQKTQSGQIPLLPPGGEFPVTIASSGETFRFSTKQPAHHPGGQAVVARVRGCNGNATTGFVNLFPHGDDDPWLAVECRANVNSFDPNFKEAFPQGYDNQHFIEPETDIQYVLHFQNTGTDTAFLVVLKDTLAATLDFGSIRPGAASHPYTWNLDGTGVLTFRFENILLPDSNVNEPASHGFVQFRIRHDEGLPLGSVIENSAAIYFDFNAPVITNQTWHTLGLDFISVSTQNPVGASGVTVAVQPNPMTDEARIFLKNAPPGEYHFELFDARGVAVQQRFFTENQLVVKKGSLAAGVYFWQIRSSGQAVARGKLVVRE